MYPLQTGTISQTILVTFEGIFLFDSSLRHGLKRLTIDVIEQDESWEGAKSNIVLGVT